jgi:multicomponent Na+:H+ antiporter subunit G
MTAAQLMGTGGIGVVLLLGAAAGMPAAVDVALVLALLAAFAAVAFVKGATPGGDGRPRGPARPMSPADLFTLACVGLGLAFFLAGTVGLLRFPDVFSRLHALTKADNLGLGLVVLGLLPRAEGVLAGLKLVLVWLLALLAAATVAQLVARVARRDDAGTGAGA